MSTPYPAPDHPATALVKAAEAEQSRAYDNGRTALE